MNLGPVRAAASEAIRIGWVAVPADMSEDFEVAETVNFAKDCKYKNIVGTVMPLPGSRRVQLPRHAGRSSQLRSSAFKFPQARALRVGG